MCTEYVMSHPDYEQTIFHHSELLVLLRGVGLAKPRSLQRIFDRVRAINHVKITDSSGNIRNIWIRYVHDYPVENNDWGDFQTHRRLLGLVSIGKFDIQTELNELCRQHESLKVRYGSTLYESRAIFFGPMMTMDEGGELQPTLNNNHSFSTPSNFKSQVFFYPENSHCEDLESNVEDFLNALFWILESKRLERSREKAEKCSLLTAPFEKREVVGLDMESRSNRKRIIGRVTKNLADLSLQAGLIEDALSLYHTACDTLRSVMDSLWVGAAEEGLCSASVCLLYAHLRTEEPFHRNASLQVGNTPTKSLHEQKKKKSQDLQKLTSDSDKKSPEQQQQQELETEQQPQQQQDIDKLMEKSPENVSKPLEDISHQSLVNLTTTTTTTTTINCTTIMGANELPSNILKPEDIAKNFQKSILNYSKYRHAVIIEIETSLKSARILIEQNRPMDVAMVLQNILCINHNLSEAERIQIFEVMTSLYERIGYKRKAAFFQRLAALKHIHQNPVRAIDWSHSYRLMLASFPGYLLSLDPMEVLENDAGWPALQIDLVQHLITAANRLGHGSLATRHMTFLLQTQWRNMSEKMQQEMALQLQNMSSKHEGSPVPLILENGTVIPPANLLDLPYCDKFLVNDLPPHLRPQRLKEDKVDIGPFLFTPLQLNIPERTEVDKKHTKTSFYWVRNNTGEIQIRLRNPLPFEIIVDEMSLLTNGLDFLSSRESVTLPALGVSQITLQGKPLEMGQLEIQGYTTRTLGVKSNCRLKHLWDRGFPIHYLVDVVPSLPEIVVKTSLPQSSSSINMKSPSTDSVVLRTNLMLYDGETSPCTITIINQSDLMIEHLEFSITSNLTDEIQRKVFQYRREDIQSQLPIPSKGQIDFVVNIFAYGEFVSSSSSSTSTTTNAYVSYRREVGEQQQHISRICKDDWTLNKGKQQQQSLNKGQQQQQSLNNGRQTHPPNTTSPIYNSFRSNKSMTSLNPDHRNSASNANNWKKVTAQFHIKYAGGEAMKEGYCRQSTIALTLEQLPSVEISNWDVLPAEICSQFYLVLDVNNLTTQEMSLQYTDTKSILIEAKELCRVPIPLDRCSLEQLHAIDDEASSSSQSSVNQQKDIEKSEYYLQMENGPRLAFNDLVSNLCSKHIAERVQIKWNLTGTDIHGVAYLKGITLTQSMIDLCTVSPLQWSIRFKDLPVQPQAEVVCVAGQSSTLDVTVCNQSLQELRNLMLTIQFYQDYLNGIQNYNLETCVAISGPSRLSIPQLDKNQSAQHRCSVVFFTPGRFKASIQCEAKPPSICLPSVNHHPPPTTTTKGVDGSNVSVGGRQVASSDSLLHQNKNCLDGYKHTWKFIPPIEITVIELQ